MHQHRDADTERGTIHRRDQRPLHRGKGGGATPRTPSARDDLSVAARSECLVVPSASLGLVPVTAPSLLFPRLLAEPMDAATAHKWGYANCVGQSGADGDRLRDGARIGRAAPPAVRLAKGPIRHGAPDVAARMTEELPLFGERLAAPAATEPFTGFMEKHKLDLLRFSRLVPR